MARPVIAANKPKQVALQQGTRYFWCACGRSARQPVCDGSHQGTGITPKPFTADADRQAWLCLCKHTGTPPFCDGTHRRFAASQVGTEGEAR